MTPACPNCARPASATKLENDGSTICHCDACSTSWWARPERKGATERDIMDLALAACVVAEWSGASIDRGERQCPVCGGMPGTPMYLTIPQRNHVRVGHMVDCVLATALTVACYPETKTETTDGE